MESIWTIDQIYPSFTDPSNSFKDMLREIGGGEGRIINTEDWKDSSLWQLHNWCHDYRGETR